MKEWLWRWGPAVVIMTVIFIASSTPGSDLPEFGPWELTIKKGGHMLGYALLAIAYVRTLKKSRPAISERFLLAAFLAVLYAITDEFHQRFTPGRTSSVRDVLIDTLGAVLALCIWFWKEKAASRRQ